MKDEEVADLLDDAHDVLLTRGRAVGTFRDSGGRVCLHGAVAMAAGGTTIICTSPAAWQAQMELFRRGFTISWNDLAQCHVAASTSNTYASSLSAFYVWAIKAELTDANPMARVDRMKHPKYKPRPTDDDDLSLALAYAQQTDARMYAWLLLAHYAGARCIEISRLQVTDINRHAMSLRLFGKGNKERVVPLHPDLLEALTAYGLPSSGHVFRKQTANTTTDSCLTPSTISRYVGRFMHELGSTATAHQGRHWFGTMVHRESGGDLLVVRDLMGHESTATSEVYTAVDVTKAAPVVGRLSA